jgi:hypothetical protein
MSFWPLILNSLGSMYIYFMIFENFNTKEFKFNHIVLVAGVRQRTERLLLLPGHPLEAQNLCAGGTK